MLSLGAVKDGVILPSEEDRKRIITQMKVRTTLKGDKSWIHHRSDSEEKQNHSPLTPCTAPSSHREPQSPSAHKNISPNSSPATSSGYLIRGVFTKTIDKSSPSKTASNETQKSIKSPSQTSPTTQGHKISTEDYKKLAPYNIKREVSHPEDGQRLVSPEEQKKRTEAASSVLRRTAGRERSYVLSAAKKTGGSPTQEVPAFVAKKIDVADDFGPRSRSQTVPASAWFNSRGKSSTNGERRTSESPQSESRLANTSVRTSVDTSSSRNVASKPYLETSFNYSTSVERSNKLDEKYEMSSGCDSVPRIPTSPKRSEKNETQSHTFFDKSSLELKCEVSNGESIPKDPDSKAAEWCHQPTTEKENVEVSPGTGYRTSTHLDNNEGADSKRSELQLGGNSLSTTGIQCELLSTPKREESDAEISRCSSFATESRFTSPYNQYRDQRSDEESDSTFYYPFRDAGINIPKSHRVPFYKDICDKESGRTLTDSETKDLPASFEQKNFANYDSDPSASGKGLLFVKESIKSMELSSSPRYNSRSLVDLSELENPSHSSSSDLKSTPSKRSLEDICTYCGRVIRNCAKISIENLNISCHDYCFKCGICHKPMGDLLDQIFIHRDIVHCNKCYEKLF